METVNGSTYLRRRVDMSLLDEEFYKNLNIVTDRFLMLSSSKQSYSFNEFRTTVISYLIDDYRDNLSDEDYDNLPYDEVYDFLLNYFYDKIKDRYDTMFGVDLQESIKKVLKEESIQDSLLDLIKTDGFKMASKTVGGSKRLMKILNLDGKNLDEFIYQYLTDNLHPDYNWGPELHDFYREDVKKYGIYEFSINDKYRYAYLGEWDGYDYLYTLVISKWANKELTSLFGDKWIPVFKKWFEYNSGLEVREIDLENKYLHL